MPRVICIIQQRLGSTRLKNKALLPLCGIPMTQHIVDRCKRAKLVDEVVVACPFKDAIVLGEALDATIVAPDVPENDLIARYYTVAKGMGADVAIRISGDNPCIEPEEIDALCGFIGGGLGGLVTNAEYIDPQMPQLGFDGLGGERYALGMLKWMNQTIKEPFYREHPHKFWYDINRYAYVGKPYPNGFRLDINNQADYEKIRDIYEHCYPQNHEFGIKEILEYLNAKKEAAQA